MDEPNTAAQPTQEEAAAKLESAVDEAIAEAPVKANWTLIVEWAPGTTDEEKLAAEESHIVEFGKEIGASPADHLPAAIEAVTIRRIHDGE